MKITFLIYALLCVSVFTLSAQEHHERYSKIDVQHYKFEISLSDVTDRIEAKAEIEILFKQKLTEFRLDLRGVDANGKGMLVHSISENGKPLFVHHENSQLIFMIDTVSINDSRIYTIEYSGIPADGLYISKNMHGQRSFFGDNYPDRGQHWLPLVDHPSDKATLEWIIIAPSAYQTIGNGMLKEVSNLQDGRNLTHWKMDYPISTKLMVFGTSKFAVEHHHEPCNVPISNWVYPEEREKGFQDFKNTAEILEFYSTNIGQYPFGKLANVQSKTRFRGMENAGNIFYDEKRVNGEGLIEDLVAHEVAHQWFGNSATELEWHHLWLSEGFATYFTELYWEHKYGRELFVERMQSERAKYLRYSKKKFTPVIDTSEENYLKLLTPNAYQKGAWILHMLRNEIGEEIFWEGIRSYYNLYKYSNALSSDFQEVMEDVSEKDLSTFFNQWLNFPGHPKLKVQWKYDGKDTLHLDIEQKQKDHLFHFPIDIKLNFEDGSSEISTIIINEKVQKTEISIHKSVDSIELDPETHLLFELQVLSKMKS